MEKSVFESEFLTSTEGSRAAYRAAIVKAMEMLCERLPAQPYSGKSAGALAQLFPEEILVSQESPVGAVLEKLGSVISESVSVTHPYTVAHLHCPPLIAALAAEVMISALNQSMDSFDQAPAATVIEEKLVRWLCGEAGFKGEAGGIFTSGGSQSNYMGLLLARDAVLDRRWKRPVQTDGLPAETRKLRILCSDVAHFTVEKSAAQLGLGTNAVVRIESDGQFRMSVAALDAALGELRKSDLFPMAIVGTAGTTDFGSIDPLTEIAALARRSGAWFHVDAAYGSALLFSTRYRARLQGIELADSISMDFHKLFWQPISCAAFLLRDAENFHYLKMNADYLNPELHEQLGIPNLVSRSLATTRRFDALKLWVSLRALGREKLGAMIDACAALAGHAADFIRNHPNLELIHEPELSSVVFRYVPKVSSLDTNRLNADLRQHLFDAGLAIIGHTIVRGRQCLKLTCMNPTVSESQIRELLELVVGHGMQLEQVPQVPRASSAS
jgi:L-2,4-diaminobutyrate decarboxylase